MGDQKIAIVTGSNKGIGYAVVKGLTEHFDGLIYLTARDETRGKEALAKLKSEVGEERGKKVAFHQLDVTNQDSVTAFAEFVKNTHGGIDCLVNNAAISFPPTSDAPMGEQAEKTLDCNFYGVVRMGRAFLPMLRADGRVVVVASRIGLLKMGAGPELVKGLTDPELNLKKLEAIVEDYKKHAKEGDWIEKGYPASAYGMSKMAVIALAKMEGRLTKDGPKKWIINCCCPGYVNTDMTMNMGMKTTEDGADTIVWLATLPPGTTSPKGEFVAERKILDWENDEMKEIIVEMKQKIIEKIGEEKAKQMFARFEKAMGIKGLGQ